MYRCAELMEIIYNCLHGLYGDCIVAWLNILYNFLFPRICKLNVLLILHGFGRKSTVTILVCYYPSASLMVGNFTQRSLTKLVKQSFDICVSMWWWWSIYNCPTWMFFIGKFSNHPCFAFTAASPLKIRIMKFIISTVKLNDSA